MLVVGVDLLAQDLLRSCADEIRDAAAARRANGEQDAGIRTAIARAATKAAGASRVDVNDAYALYLGAMSGTSTTADPGFALGGCFYGRRLRQLAGAPLNIKAWVGKYNIGPASPDFYVLGPKPTCVAFSMTKPMLSDSGYTYRFDITMRNICATTQLVLAERRGALEMLEIYDDHVHPVTWSELRELPTGPEWPEWKSTVPGNVRFRPVASSRARARPMLPGQTVRIPYIYDVRAVWADFGGFDVYAMSCPAYSPDGYYQFMFRGEFGIEGETVARACVPNVEAGKPARR